MRHSGCLPIFSHLVNDETHRVRSDGDAAGYERSMAARCWKDPPLYSLEDSHFDWAMFNSYVTLCWLTRGYTEHLEFSKYDTVH